MSLEELRSYLDAISKATYTKGGRYVVDGPEGAQTFTMQELADERKRIQKMVDDLETAQEETETAATRRRIEVRVSQRERARNEGEIIRRYRTNVQKLNELASLFAKGRTQYGPDVEKYEGFVAKSEEQLRSIGLMVAEDGSIVRQVRGGRTQQVAPAVTQPPGEVKESPVTGEFAPAAGIGEMPPRDRRRVTTGDQAPGAGPAATTAAAAPARTDVNTWIDTQLELRNLEDNKKNRAALRAEYKIAKMALPADWREKFAARFPGLEYMLNENIFGPEVIEIIQRAVSERWFLYPETAAALIKREIANTPYGMNATQKQEAFDAKSGADQMAAVQKRAADLQKSYGMLGLSTAEWQELAYVAERNGEDDLLTQQRLFQTIYDRTPDGDRKYETAVRMVENGRLGQEVNREYAKYLLKAPEDAIEMYATGQTTLENIRQQSRAAAKFMFPALGDLIDQGVDVKFVADQYAATAADVLEQAPGTIDMMDPRYRVALDVRDGANSRTMSLGEWQTLLKTDPNYGWQYTKQANQQSMDIATTIARVFGKVQ